MDKDGNKVGASNPLRATNSAKLRLDNAESELGPQVAHSIPYYRIPYYSIPYSAPRQR